MHITKAIALIYLLKQGCADAAGRQAVDGHCHVRKFYLSAAKLARRPNRRKSTIGEPEVAADPLKNRLFLASVTMPSASGRSRRHGAALAKAQLDKIASVRGAEVKKLAS